MTSKEALKCIVVDLVPKARENNKEEIEQIEKDLEILEKLKKVLSKVTYTPEFVYDKEDENGFVPVDCEYKVTCGEEFDIVLFKKLVDQLGFELKEKTKN